MTGAAAVRVPNYVAVPVSIYEYTALKEGHESDSHGLPLGKCDTGKFHEIRLRAAIAQMVPIQTP
jgi:hypothetical protein